MRKGPIQSLEGRGPADTLMFGFGPQNCERIDICGFQPSLVRYFEALADGPSVVGTRVAAGRPCP